MPFPVAPDGRCPCRPPLLRAPRHAVTPFQPPASGFAVPTPSEWASRHARPPAQTPLPSIAVPTKADPARRGLPNGRTTPTGRTEPPGSRPTPVPTRQAGQKRKKLRNFFRSLRAVGETRTHTGQRPLPPQSSVSTISPLPQICLPNFRLGLQIYARIFNLQNFFNIFSHTYIQYALCFKKVFLSLHPHPRVGCNDLFNNFLKQIHNGC